VTSSSTDRKQLVVFGLIMAAAAFFFGWLYEFTPLHLVAAAFLLTALIVPRLLLPLYRPWMRLAEILGWINTRVILILIFYLVVTPIGLVLRLFRRSPLALERRNGSFWAPAPKHSWGDKHFEKQF
jgi:hypothetical protein